ncbi:MAG: hypothetical protein ACFFCV_20175 [Promethearchaeota archaeon]
MICKDCQNSYLMAEDGSDYFCPKCQEKYEMRKAFRSIMAEIDKINKMDSRERNFLSGFSWAEKEHFSLIMKRFLKANHFPVEDKDFANDYSRKELKYIKETIIF